MADPESDRFPPHELPACGPQCQANSWAQTMLKGMREIRETITENAEKSAANAEKTAAEIAAIKERLAKGDAKLDDAGKNEASITKLTETVQALTIQLVELKTKLGVLWVTAGAAGVAAVGSLVTAILALLGGHK